MRARRTGAGAARGVRQSEARRYAPRAVAFAAREVYCAGGGKRRARLERHVRALAAGEEHDDPAANRVHLVELRFELQIRRIAQYATNRSQVHKQIYYQRQICDF